MSVIKEVPTFDFAEDIFGTGLTLNIDGDILVYRPCCVHNEDNDASRRAIVKNIKRKLADILAQAGCDDYRFFVTTKFNFRDQLVNDYKANRNEVDRPVNLAWAKRWAIQHLNCYFHKGLEADDLLGIYMDDKSVLWSLDKDLRQIAGLHLDDNSGKVIRITPEGQITDNGKVYFDGLIGFYYQLLIGDNTDHILGCAERKAVVTKSGPNKGQSKVKRVGVGPKAAIKILSLAAYGAAAKGEDQLQACKEAVGYQYKKIYGDAWQGVLETQANLLFMVREKHGEVIKRWTFDDREEYFDLVEGKILDEFTPPNKELRTDEAS